MIFELQFVLILVLIVLSAFFSGAEVALVSVDELNIKKLSKQRAKGIRTLKKLKENPHRMITTILIGNNIVNILLSSMATAIAIDSFGSVGLGIAVGVTTFIILIFGEIFPKSYAETHDEKVALITAPIIYLLSKIFYPVIVLFELIPLFLIKYLFKSAKKKEVVTEEDIVALAELGVEKEAIDIEEKETIEKVLHFDEISVKSVMVPKNKIIYMNANSNMLSALKIMDKFGHSRYPVFENKKSNVIGIVHIKEILRTLHAKEYNTQLKYLTIHALQFNENEKLDGVFKKLQKNRVHMALVVNKKGSVVGLVTLEDIIEEIFGEIEDEEDVLRRLSSKKF